jgi:hypothetical protein
VNEAVVSARIEPEAPFDVAAARSYIASVRWQFAETMPQWPHEYTVRDWRPELEAVFEAFAQLIRDIGVVKPWPRDSPRPRHHNIYLAIDDWEYWTMGAPIAETTVINRARLGDDPSLCTQAAPALEPATLGDRQHGPSFR